MVGRLLAGLAVALGVVQADFARADVGVWTTGGPDGGHVQALAIDPAVSSTVYAGTSAGVFRTTTGGASWSRASAGLTNFDVRTLAIDPVIPAIVYAGTAGGVFKSTNGGTSWSAASTGLPNLSVIALAIDPAAPNILYAGFVGGLFKSTDGGASWHQSDTGLGNSQVRSLATDPLIPATLYASTTASGVFKSIDAGGSWSSSSAGLDFPGCSCVTEALAVDPLTPGTLYVARRVTVGGVIPGVPNFVTTVFKSTNGASSWTALVIVNPQIVSAIAVAPTSSSIVLVATASGVFKR
jgi:photosystem II stability/assembly factor-like uncharacterized protein